MFGEHDRETAERIAAQKRIELHPRKCMVVPGIMDPKKWTIAVQLVAPIQDDPDINHIRKT